MAKYFKPESGFGTEAECAICYCMWKDPVELETCEHIFCKECIKDVSTCPECRCEITGMHQPNNVILRLLMRAPGRCSTCAWRGTYRDYNEKHLVCLPQGAKQEEEVVAPEDCAALLQQQPSAEDYFLENGPHGQQKNHHGETRSSHHALGSSSSSPLSASNWRQEISSTAKDYGLKEAEFSSLLEHFPEFSTNGSNGRPELRWREACRLLRYYNFPNHPDDVTDLFQTARQSPADGGVSFHALCLWLPLNRRNNQQWYGLTAAMYDRLLSYSQLLDEAKTGLFTLEQARLLAEEFFQRDISDSEWDNIGELIRKKESYLRQSFPSSCMRVGGPMSDNVNRMYASSQLLRIPFHDMLLAFRKHREVLEQHTNSDAYATRIRALVNHYHPAGAAAIENTIQQFRGDEENLLSTLVTLYGPEPSSTVTP